MHATLEADNHLKQALSDRQLPQGRWPCRKGFSQAANEPTGLALLALRSDKGPVRDQTIWFLLETQNANGSWPAFAGDDQEGFPGHIC
jgi:hypothetical protein